MPSNLPEWITESKAKIERPQSERFERGHWLAAYRIVGNLSQHTVHQLDQILREVERTVNPVPQFLNDGVLNRSTAESNDAVTFKVCNRICVFWRASPVGYFFVASTFGEDNHANAKSPTLHTMLPAWRAAECVAHAAKLATLIGGEARLIQMQMKWHGLTGRELYEPNRFEPTSIAIQADVESAIVEATLTDIESNPVRAVQELTASFYSNFGANYTVNWLGENPNIRG